MKQKSNMKHQFSQIPKAEIQRSSFDRTSGLKTTFNAGYLIPILVDEALPGDTFNVDATLFARLNTPIFPLMDNMFLETFFFAVPYRLVWENWKKFNGEQINPGDSIDYTVPTMDSTAITGYPNESIHDYFGIPTKIPDLTHNSLHHRASNLIWNEWFRDQNLQNSLVVDTDDGPDDPTDYVLMQRGKRHDYFTSALPWPQKGTAVDLPLGTRADVKGIGKVNQNFSGASTNVYETGASGTTNYPVNDNNLINGSNADGSFRVMEDLTNVGFPDIYADLTSATAATINELREAFQVQRLMERDARGGTRYIEVIKSHFGVTSPDARLQRPEYLGGGSTNLNMVNVPQTSSTDATTPQGNLSGYGTFTAHNHGFTKSFTEHNLILGFVNVRADLNYQQGLNRMWNRQTRYDFFWPSLAHLGEQEILNKEIYAQGSVDPTADAAVFGYQERFAEYRYKPSLITGKMRSNDATSLDAWHLAQDFSALPTLSSSFIVDNPPMDRVVAVTAEPDFNLDGYIKMKCARPMPLYSVPGMIDHF